MLIGAAHSPDYLGLYMLRPVVSFSSEELRVRVLEAICLLSFFTTPVATEIRTEEPESGLQQLAQQPLP